jgi:zinc protease
MLLFLSLLGCPKDAPPEATAVTVVDPLSERPGVPEARPFVPPTAQTFTHSSGAEVIVVEQPGLPLVSVELVVHAGAADYPKPAALRLSNSLLLRGAGERDSSAFAQTLEQQALSLSVSTHQSASVMSLSGASDKLDLGMELMADAVLRPVHDAKELDKLKERSQASLDESLARPQTVASWVGDRYAWGQDHPRAMPPIGDSEAIRQTSLEDAVTSHGLYWRPDLATFVFTGDVDQARATQLLDAHFGDWSAQAEFPSPQLVEPSWSAGYYLVDDPGATQSSLRVILPGWSAMNEEIEAARLGTLVLGGTFTSRLNRLLREEKGYTYGARSSLSYGPSWGHLVAYSSVRADVTGLALKDLWGELEKIQAGGIDEAELVKAKGARTTSLMEAVETRSGTASTLAWYAIDGQPVDQMSQSLAEVEAADLAAANAAMASIDLSQAIVVVVGDLEQVRPQLAEVLPELEWTVVDK